MYSEIEKELMIHKNKIIEQLELYQKIDRVFEKYIWIANYHNYYCNNFLNKEFYNLKSLIIKKKHFKTISRIIN